MMFSSRRAATRRSSSSAASTARLVARARARRSTRLALLGLDRGVDGQDAAVGALGRQRRGLGLGVAVEADDDLLAGLDARGCARGGSRPARAFM